MATEENSRRVAIMKTKEIYLGTKIEKVSDPDSEGVILSSKNYEGEINHIGISHERTMR